MIDRDNCDQLYRRSLFFFLLFSLFFLFLPYFILVCYAYPKLIGSSLIGFISSHQPYEKFLPANWTRQGLHSIKDHSQVFTAFQLIISYQNSIHRGKQIITQSMFVFSTFVSPPNNKFNNKQFVLYQFISQMRTVITSKSNWPFNWCLDTQKVCQRLNLSATIRGAKSSKIQWWKSNQPDSVSTLSLTNCVKKLQILSWNLIGCHCLDSPHSESCLNWRCRNNVWKPLIMIKR